MVSACRFAAIVVFGVLAIQLAAALAQSAPQPGHPPDQFGVPLSFHRDLGIGGSMDAAVEGDTLYVISGSALKICDIQDRSSPQRVGVLGNLGNLRQIVVQDGIAYITARADGLFIIDARQPTKPKLLCHYDTIEVATGIAIEGRLAFVACRSCGVEIVDVADPSRPVHLSTIRTGEAQSVVARGRYLYTGVWASSELVVTDITNPRQPRITAKLQLDGYGDGVDVQGNYCYVATGHHSQERPKRKPGDPGFGHGHGLEVFDLTNPAKPRFVSRIKLPPLYSLGMDMWSVTVADKYAFVADTFNGLFIVDVSDPSRLRIVAQRQLPYINARRRFSPVGGFALAKDFIYVAGAWSDLHVVSAPGFAQPPRSEPREQLSPPWEAPKTDPRVRTYRPPGQVHAVAVTDNIAFVAAGQAGLHAVQIEPQFKNLDTAATAGFAFDVKTYDNRVYLAEGKGGLSVWRWSEADSKLEQVGAYRPKGTVRQVVVPPPGKYALLQVGANLLQIVDVRDPQRMTRVFEDSRLGMMHGHPIAERLLDRRYVSCFWHVTGHYWYDLGRETGPAYTGDHFPLRIGAHNGMAVVDDRVLFTYRGKYFLGNRKTTAPPARESWIGIAGVDLSGEPSLFGTRLYVSNRISGRVAAVDISDIRQPRLLGSLQLREHPEIVVDHRGAALIPAGFQGLLLWRPLPNR